MSSDTSPQIAVARLLRSQGRRGELLAEALSNLPGLFEVGRRFGCSPEAGRRATPAKPACFTLESVWTPTGRNAGRLVMKLSGIDSISAADALAGRELLLDQADLPVLDPDTFLVGDLVGCTLLDGDLAVGEIVGVDFPTGPDGRTRLEDAAPFLLVRASSPEGEEPDDEPVLVPFVKAWLQEVDTGRRAVRMTLPEGLFADMEASDEEPPSEEAEQDDEH